MKNTFLAVVAGVALMACSPSTEPTPAATVEPAAATPAPIEPAPPTTAPATDPALADTCNMTQYAALIGKPATDAGVPPASATVRIIKPGDQVTMDLLTQRLEFHEKTAWMLRSLLE